MYPDPRVDNGLDRAHARGVRGSPAPWDPPPRPQDLTDHRLNAIARRRRAAFDDNDDLDRGID